MGLIVLRGGRLIDKEIDFVDLIVSRGRLIEKGIDFAELSISPISMTTSTSFICRNISLYLLCLSIYTLFIIVVFFSRRRIGE